MTSKTRQLRPEAVMEIDLGERQWLIDAINGRINHLETEPRSGRVEDDQRIHNWRRLRDWFAAIPSPFE